MAGNLNVKHMHWNSRPITTKGALLRDYDDRNACLIFGPDSPTTVPYQQNTNPDVLDIVVIVVAASAPKRSPCADQRSPLAAGIRDEIHLKIGDSSRKSQGIPL
jgi:hypothetical protein